MSGQELQPVETFLNRIQQNQTDFLAAYNNYKLCYVNFNIKDDNSNIQCSTIINTPGSNCNNCLKTSENIIIRTLTDIQTIQNDIEKEVVKIKAPTTPQDVTQKQKDDLSNMINRYNTTHESLLDSVELYKTYRIQLISEIVKLLVILFIIFYLLKTTKGIKSSTFISAIIYITLSSLHVFYRGYILFIFSVLSFFIFVVFSIMNINDISINYQNIANKTTETLTNISTEFKKDVNVL